MQGHLQRGLSLTGLQKQFSALEESAKEQVAVGEGIMMEMPPNKATQGSLALCPGLDHLLSTSPEYQG